MKIENSQRLSYELMTKNDADLLFQLDQDPEVMRYINGGKANSRAYIENIYIPRLEGFTNHKKGWGLWKVTLMDSKKFIGWILVRPMDFFSNAPQPNNLEIGWRFMQKFWGSGYATEAAKTIKEAFIKQCAIKQFTAIADANNIGSINIMKKLDMSFVKKEFQQDPLGDINVVYYQVLL